MQGASEPQRLSVVKRRYEGSCHCGAVRFHVDADITELTTCDCSLCRRKNALMAAVPETALSIETGKDMLSLYEWNTGIGKHYFCRRCGIYTFHRKRMLPEQFGINVMCLDDFDIESVPIRRTKGSELSIESPRGAPAARSSSA